MTGKGELWHTKEEEHVDQKFKIAATNANVHV